jgi:hypothetical protein
MRRRRGGDDAEDEITLEDGGSRPQTKSVAVLVDEDPLGVGGAPKAEPHSKKRRINRLEEVPFTHEERLKVEQEIIEANGNMRDVEDTKKIQDKIWNGQIADYETTMNEAIDILKKGGFTTQIERIEEFDYDTQMVRYYNVDTGHEVDSRDMTDDELQTRMDM